MKSNPAADSTLFLTVDQVAREIGCTRRFIETRIKDGELRVFRPSARLVRVRRAELERWIEAYSSSLMNGPPGSQSSAAAGIY